MNSLKELIEFATAKTGLTVKVNIIKKVYVTGRKYADNFKETMRIISSDFSWTIEEYHRGLKQFCGIERCQCRAAKAWRNHICPAVRTFLRFEIFSLKSGYSWFEAKTRIIRDAVRAYLSAPVYAF